MRLLTIVLFVVSSLSAFSQYQAEKFEAALVEAKYGAMLVYNGQRNSFTLKFVSGNIKPSEKPGFLAVDDMLMGASITPFQQELNFENFSEEAQKKWLTDWKKYEGDWIAEQLKIKLTETASFVTIGQKLFLHWTFNMPESQEKGAIVKQVYLVTICFDHMLILSAPLEKGKSESALTEKLKTIAGTLQLNRGQVLDLEKLYDELKKE